MHICGNLKHFIGHLLGGTDYLRNREKEFLLSDVEKEELLKNIDETLEIIKSTLKKLDPNSINKKYPIDVLGYEMTTEYFLIHLAAHLNYHLDQINYLRRFYRLKEKLF